MLHRLHETRVCSSRFHLLNGPASAGGAVQCRNRGTVNNLRGVPCARIRVPLWRSLRAHVDRIEGRAAQGALRRSAVLLEQYANVTRGN